ncbi:MAG: glycoside hydrolase family 30 beta sandwich domain-containing protein [Bergeyella sp.]
MKILTNKYLYILLIPVLLFCSGGSSDTDSGTTTEPPATNYKTGEVWLTKSDQTVKLQKQSNITFNNNLNTFSTIEVKDSETYQTIDGFGFTLTGGSVEVLNTLSATKRDALLQELFGSGTDGIAISYLRLSIGSSDLNSEVFSYDDVPAGQTDEDLSEFSLAKDQAVIDMLKKILTINPAIKIVATPWSAPVWMKTNGSSIGGSLKEEYYGVYAQYFVKYIQGMAAQGIKIDAITPQNEPLHDGNNPSLYMPAEQQRDFIKNNLGPAFQAAGITTKIIAWDHNADNIAYATTVLSDPAAAAFVDGSAFHLYNGDISNLSNLRNAFPLKNIYFTEQYTPSTGSFSGDLVWHIKNVIIGATRNWSRNALEWNLANDANFKPYTPGGCTVCKGAITVNIGDTFDRNVGYYIIAQASKFVPQNSVRIYSSQVGNLSTVAFKRPDGKIALIVLNTASTTENFNIKYAGESALTSLPSGSVATYIF